jgi:acetyltransferase
MFEPSSLVIVADRPLPATGSLSPALKAKTTVVACEVGAAPDLPDSLQGLAAGERPDLALVCVSPAACRRRCAACRPCRPAR